MPAPLPTPSGVMHFRCMHELAALPLYSASFDLAYTGTAPTTATLTAFAEDCRTAYAGNVAGLLPAAWSLNQVEVTDLAVPSTIAGLDTTVVDGTRSGASALDSKCACVIYTPDRRYRGSRPKGFWPWGVDGDLGSGKTWGSAFISAVETAFVNFLAAFATNTHGGTSADGQVSVSYITGPYAFVPSGVPGRGRIQGTPRNPPLVIKTLGVVCSPKVGQQRRRLLGG